MNYTETQIITAPKVSIENHLANIGITTIKEEILKGLRAKNKYIPSKFFYDSKGSELFEQITHLDEYYPTRTEKSILSGFIKEANIDFNQMNIIELGSGDSSKIKLLLKQIPQELLATIHYFPVDISHSAIKKSIKKISQEFELRSVTGIVADFVQQLYILPEEGKKLFCFFGSTIGNFSQKDALQFIKNIGAIIKPGDGFLLGTDMVKDAGVLERAYNDRKGITAAFNKNILNVVNTFCKTNFNTNDFEHIAFYNHSKKRIEMHLKALKELNISIKGSTKQIHFNKGESIHTENSQKFTQTDISKFAKAGNFHLENTFSDDRKHFLLSYYKK